LNKEQEKEIAVLLDYKQGRILLANMFMGTATDEMFNFSHQLFIRRKWVRRTMRKRYNK